MRSKICQSPGYSSNPEELCKLHVSTSTIFHSHWYFHITFSLMHPLHWTKTPKWGRGNGSVLTDITCWTVMRTKSNPKHPCKARHAKMCLQSQLSLGRNKRMPGACWTAGLANQTPGSARDPIPTNEMKSDWGKHLMVTSGLHIHMHMHPHTRANIYTCTPFIHEKISQIRIIKCIWKNLRILFKGD